MKRALRRELCVIAAMGISLLTACTGTENSAEAKAEPVQVRQAGSQPRGNLRAKSAVAAKKDLLRVKMVSEGSSAEEKNFARETAQQTAGELSKEDARIMMSGPCDLQIVIRPRLKEIDRDGGYYRMNCDVLVEIKSPAVNQVFGSRELKIVSPRRGLGKPDAISKLTSPAVKAIAGYCRKELQRITASEVSATLISIQFYSMDKNNTIQNASAIKSVGDILAKLNPISYELTAQDLDKGTCQYRLVYFSSAYPNGIVNEVNAQLEKYNSTQK